MKLIFSLFTLLGVGGVFYFYYLRSQAFPTLSRVPSKTGINLVQPPTDLTSVLGETTSRLFENGIDALNNVTNDQAEPIINKAVSDLKERVKELPQEQYKKVKYEFCKDVLETEDK